MIKKTITYKNFNDESVTEDFYFNLTKAELMEMQLEREGGLSSYIESIGKAQDTRGVIAIFKLIIRRAYGEKTPDGRGFLKDDKSWFFASDAYSELFMELATDSNKAIEFINGLIPQDLLQKANEAQAPQIEEPKDVKLLTDDEFYSKFGKDPANWSNETLMEAMRRRSAQQPHPDAS